MRYVVHATPRHGRFFSQKRPGNHCTGGWVGPREGLDGCGKSRPHRNSIPGQSSPQRVATPTELSSQRCYMTYITLLIEQRENTRIISGQFTFPYRKTHFLINLGNLLNALKTLVVKLYQVETCHIYTSTQFSYCTYEDNTKNDFEEIRCEIGLYQVINLQDQAKAS